MPKGKHFAVAIVDADRDMNAEDYIHSTQIQKSERGKLAQEQ